MFEEGPPSQQVSHRIVDGHWAAAAPKGHKLQYFAQMSGGKNVGIFIGRMTSPLMLLCRFINFYLHIGGGGFGILTSSADEAEGDGHIMDSLELINEAHKIIFQSCKKILINISSSPSIPKLSSTASPTLDWF